MTTLRFWKPFDVLSKFTDDQGRATLADYIDLPDVYGAGRLDRDSEGLLILSDEPALRTMLTDPDHHVPRSYAAQVEGVPDETALARLRAGVEIKGRMTRGCEAELVDAPDFPERSTPIRVRKNIPDRWIRLTLTEGRNRQVRRMTAAVGHPTLRLVRVSIGPIGLGGLTPGRWEELTGNELHALRAAARDQPPRSAGSNVRQGRRRGNRRRG